MTLDKLVEYIHDCEEKIENSCIHENFKFNLQLWLDLIETSVNKRYMFSSIALLRSYRNIIYALITEMYLMTKYSEILTFHNNLISLNKIPELYRDKTEKEELLNKMEKLLIETGHSTLDDEVKLIRDTKSIYYKQPTYLWHSLAEIDINGWILSRPEFELLKIMNRRVVNYVREEILISDKNISRFDKANLICNNSVHKNNYDSEDFENSLSDKSSILLYDIMEIYNNIIFEFISKIKK